VSVVRLVAIVAAVWLATAGAAAAVDGSGHWLPSGVAALLCLVPAAATLVVLKATEHASLVVSLGAVLVAPVARLAAVAVVGAVLWQAVPDFTAQPVRFAAWVMGFYLLTLAAETAVLLARAGRPKPTGGAGA
jgi:hypothetical protein